jgi:hypothetical protein
MRSCAEGSGNASAGIPLAGLGAARFDNVCQGEPQLALKPPSGTPMLRDAVIAFLIALPPSHARAVRAPLGLHGARFPQRRGEPRLNGFLDRAKVSALPLCIAT